MNAFGDQRVDDYFWLREKENPAVIDYLKAEFARFRLRRGHAAPLMRGLYYDAVWLRETLQTLGFHDVEIVIFPVRSSGQWHSFVLARK